MNRRRFVPPTALAALLFLAPISTGHAAPTALTRTDRLKLIERTLEELRAAYVFPAVARRMEVAIWVRWLFGHFRDISDPVEFAHTLTDDLRRVSNDQHLAVYYSPDVLPPQRPPPEGESPAPPAPPAAEISLDQARRFGFVRTEILAGNIGYVDLRGFDPSPEVAGAAAAVMTFLAGSDAVIFDVRRNSGGSPKTVALIASYLFGPEPVHLNDFYNRVSNQTLESWTLPEVAGPRLTDKAAYVLIGSQTFSGGEEFAYDLQALRRATLVGETTRGGAHTAEPRRLNDHFWISVPSGRPINPITKTNWEGVGVKPDLEVAAPGALPAAQRLALQNLGRQVPEDQLGLAGGEPDAFYTTPSSPFGSSALLPPTPAASFQGDFEPGHLEAWTSVGEGRGGWFVYSDGQSAPEPAMSDVTYPFNVPPPPQGRYAAVTDGNGASIRILYQDIVLDRPYRLQLEVFYVSSGPLQAGPELALTDAPNQQYRIDLIERSASRASLAPADVLANVFRTADGGPLRQEYSSVTFDLSPWSGQTVRLRFAVVDNRGPLRAGVDHVRLEPIP